MSSPNESNSQKLLELVNAKLGNNLKSSELSLGDVVVSVDANNITSFLKLLKLDNELRFNLLLSVTAVDWFDSRPNRFEVVYHLLSTEHLYRLRVKVELPEDKPEIESITGLWSGANFMEREVWDMYGVKFLNHPDLRKILMYEEFVGHPLRKDYPVQGKQPRIPLRSPEVRNTAVDMQRPALVKINPRSRKSDDKEGKSEAARTF